MRFYNTYYTILRCQEKFYGNCSITFFHGKTIFFNNDLRLLSNETNITSFNCGYAILTSSGETIKLSTKSERDH